jgi:GLPGLI family protein
MYMKKIFLSLFVFSFFAAGAQQFINEGKIEYEVRVNNHRMFGDGIWAEMIKNRVANFSTYYYNLYFKDGKAVYKFDRENAKDKIPFGDNNREDNIWFNDYSSNTFIHQKFVFDGIYLLSDSLMKIDWKMVPNETREIAGFNCKKAQGIIFDSVYVFAFYTDEITTPGGPMGIHGLPGMIMGITIPRMFTSWIATKLELTDNAKLITPPTKGKKKQATELRTNVEKVTKDWGTWGQQSVWNIFL